MARLTGGKIISLFRPGDAEKASQVQTRAFFPFLLLDSHQESSPFSFCVLLTSKMLQEERKGKAKEFNISTHASIDTFFCL